jgi:hypothetical protein
VKPRRIQRRRAKGWRMPAGAVYVGRRSKWGNPYHPEDHAGLTNVIRLGLAGGCRAGRDGDCTWAGCPQALDGEPMRSGRHCPLDKGAGDE